MTRIVTFLHNAFSPLVSRIQLRLDEVAYELVKCAKAETYVETLGRHADALHSWIDQVYEEDLLDAFMLEIRPVVQRLGIGIAELAVDFTSEPFYGKSVGPHIIGITGEAYRAEFKFLVVSVTRRNKSMPLIALPVIVGEGVASPTIKALKICQGLFKHIRIIKFDRGFYSTELIEYLEARGLKYLILCPEKKGVIEEYARKTVRLGTYEHEMRLNKDKTVTRVHTTIVVCKGVSDFDWIFATNVRLRTAVEYVLHYKRRWQIETNFRVEDEAKIKTKSTKYLIRYFYFLIALLLHVLWTVNKNTHYESPFKRYLDNIEKSLLLDAQAVT